MILTTPVTQRAASVRTAVLYVSIESHGTAASSGTADVVAMGIVDDTFHGASVGNEDTVAVG
jgi:hypothetical protein